MALRSPALWMGNPAVQHTAQNDRLLLAALMQPEAGQTAATRPLTAVSGVLSSSSTVGRLTLLSNTQFTVDPARWIVYSTASALGGAYLVTNDAVSTLSITAQDATQYRRSYFGVWVVDSFVAGSGDDLPHWGLVDGPLAASAGTATLPAAGSLPANFLALGEFAIPPVGQNVTYTGYDTRTGLRGSIIPVSSTDARPGAVLGSYRDHPVAGLQRWDGTTWNTPNGDSGWVNVPVGSGFAGLAGQGPQVRKVGNLVVSRGSWSNTGIVAGGSYTGVATVPVGFRPIVAIVVPMGSGTGDATGSGQIRETGDVWLRASATLGSYYSWAGLSWFADS